MLKKQSNVRKNHKAMQIKIQIKLAGWKKNRQIKEIERVKKKKKQKDKKKFK